MSLSNSPDRAGATDYSTRIGSSGTPESVMPAIVATFLLGFVFTALKFVLIGRIALDFDPQAPGALDPLPWDWLREVILTADRQGGLKDALSQGISAILTLGLILGFPINGPLAGAWRCNRLFAFSFVCVGAASLLTLWSNPWFWATVIGIVYGTGCAARGKVIPLLSHALGRSNTYLCGCMNAALSIGLLVGSLVGSFVSELPDISHLQRHLIVLCIALAGFISAWFIRVPEPQPVPLARGVRLLARSTSLLFRRHWALLLGGGLAWGIASACSLAIYVHAVDSLGMKRSHAVTLVLFAGCGAIIGNLVSHVMATRFWVVTSFILQAAIIGLYPHVVHGYWSAAVLLCAIAFLFAAPANVLDAKFLANSHDDELTGLGATTMGFTHSVCILVISLFLAVPLFLGAMSAETQFSVLAAISVLSCGVVLGAGLEDGSKPRRGHGRAS